MRSKTINISPLQKIRQAGFDVEIRQAKVGVTVYLLKSGQRVAKAKCMKTPTHTMDYIRLRAELGILNKGSTLRALLEIWALDPAAVMKAAEAVGVL